jgi:type VII secretion-associated serine protease mycosin
VTVILAATTVPVVVGPTAGTARASKGVATCTNAVAPAAPVADLPWAQARYAPQRLAVLSDGAGVTVAVVDSGVDDNHPQLRGRVLAGRDFLDPSGDGRLDCVGHGTAVASIIAGRDAGGVEFRGLAPAARILPIRISEQQIIEGRESGRTVTAAQFARGIRWAVDAGADVINLSVVLYQDNPDVRAAVAHALASDVVVVAAVGNLHENGDPVPYPAAYDGVLGVGAIGPDGALQPFSQVGSYVDVVAPGGAVLAAVPRRGHKEQSGTSYATPFVAATAALVRAYRPDLPAAAVVARILATADPVGGGQGFGRGVVNPYRAVAETPTVAGPAASAAPLPASVADPAERARAARRISAEHRAVWLAAGALCAALVVGLLAAVLPRGSRRRWRAG